MPVVKVSLPVAPEMFPAKEPPLLTVNFAVPSVTVPPADPKSEPTVLSKLFKFKLPLLPTVKAELEEKPVVAPAVSEPQLTVVAPV